MKHVILFLPLVNFITTAFPDPEDHAFDTKIKSLLLLQLQIYPFSNFP